MEYFTVVRPQSVTAQGLLRKWTEGRSGRRTKLPPEVLTIVEEQMQRDDETTAAQLEALLTACNHPLSLSAMSKNTRLDFPR